MLDEGFFANDTDVLVCLTCAVELHLLGFYREKDTKKHLVACCRVLFVCLFVLFCHFCRHRLIGRMTSAETAAGSEARHVEDT